MKTRSLLLAVFVIAIGSTPEVAGGAGESCVYGKRTWKDGSYRVTGASCQLCNAGYWVDRDNSSANPDAKCVSPDQPASESAQSIAPERECSLQDSLFSDGAVHAHDGQCWRCALKKWLALADSFCN
jgi:hypothetical protein